VLTVVVTLALMALVVGDAVAHRYGFVPFLCGSFTQRDLPLR